MRCRNIIFSLLIKGSDDVEEEILSHRVDLWIMRLKKIKEGMERGRKEGRREKGERKKREARRIER